MRALSDYIRTHIHTQVSLLKEEGGGRLWKMIHFSPAVLDSKHLADDKLDGVVGAVNSNLRRTYKPMTG